MRCICFVTFFLVTSVFLFGGQEPDSLKKRAVLLNDSLERIKCYQAISDYYINGEQFDSALVYLSRALQLCRSKNTDKSKARINCNLGVLYKELGFFDEALKHYINALTYFDQQNDYKNGAQVKINIGQLYNVMKQYGKALSVIRESVFLLGKTGMATDSSPPLAFAYNNQAIAFQNLDQTDSALHYYLKALSIKMNLKNYLNASYTLNNLGTLYVDKDIDKALGYFFESMALKRKLKNVGGLVNGYTNIGQIYEKKGEVARALLYQDSAMLLLADLNNPELRSSVLYNLSSVHEKNNNYQRALNYLKEYVVLNDSINGSEVSKKIATLQFMYENEKKEKEIQLSKASIHLLEKEIVIKNNRTLILVSIALALILLLVLLYRQYKSKLAHAHSLAKSKAELEEKNNELNKSLVLNQKLQQALKHDADNYKQLAYRKQMNPHFIFNSLNAIQNYILTKSKLEANLYLGELATLIRRILENSEKELITLKEELFINETYIRLEQKRFEGEFDYRLTVAPDVDPATVKIPPLLLQPFIENSIWHGLLHQPRQALLEINIRRRTGSSIVISIKDNGVGREQAGYKKNANGSKSESMGVNLTAERINLNNYLAGDEITLHISDLVDSDQVPLGTEVTIIIQQKQE